jgi:hypothetical protein
MGEQLIASGDLMAAVLVWGLSVWGLSLLLLRRSNDRPEPSAHGPADEPAEAQRREAGGRERHR